MYIKSVLLLFALFLQPQQTLNFDELTEKEVEDSFVDLPKVILTRLLKEADTRKTTDELKEYLETSFKVWNQKLETLGYNHNSPPNKLSRGAIMSEKALETRVLLEERYFASLSDDEATFGQFLAKGEVLQIIDEENMLVNINPLGGDKELLVWIAGVSTQGYVDDQDLDLTFFANKIWRNDGGESYTNTLGAKQTVMKLALHPLAIDEVLKQIDLFKFGHNVQEFDKARKRFVSEQRQKKKQEKHTRTWTDSSGSFSIVATFSGLSQGQVRLIKQDGSSIRILLDKLSKEDQDWIAALKP